MKSFRYAIAALISGTASWVLPLLLAAYVMVTDPGLDRMGEPDDAPFRSAGLLLAISPVAILVLSVFYAALGGLLRLAKRESIGVFLIVSGFLASLAGIVFSRQGFVVGGAADAAISFGIFGLGSFLCLTFGSLAWIRYAP